MRTQIGMAAVLVTAGVATAAAFGIGIGGDDRPGGPACQAVLDLTDRAEVMNDFEIREAMVEVDELARDAEPKIKDSARAALVALNDAMNGVLSGTNVDYSTWERQIAELVSACVREDYLVRT